MRATHIFVKGLVFPVFWAFGGAGKARPSALRMAYDFIYLGCAGLFRGLQPFSGFAAGSSRFLGLAFLERSGDLNLALKPGAL